MKRLIKKSNIIKGYVYTNFYSDIVDYALYCVENDISIDECIENKIEQYKEDYKEYLVPTEELYEMSYNGESLVQNLIKKEDVEKLWSFIIEHYKDNTFCEIDEKYYDMSLDYFKKHFFEECPAYDDCDVIEDIIRDVYFEHDSLVD